ncbi:Tartrate-resistant acid phosphatase type 5 [Entophlyctis luteolus]|nr:Tartrate-resistant acid phosphatase type 5 [Entophlyctis luteolus]
MLPLHTSAVPLSFLLIGDWGQPDNTQNVTGVAESLARVGKSTNATAVISVGDNFYKGGSYDYDGIVSPDDSKFTNLWKNVYDLDVPWWLVLGNHDWYTAESFRYELEFSGSGYWQLPDFFYTKRVLFDPETRSHASFIFIDTNYLQYGYSDSEQNMTANFDRAGWGDVWKTTQKQLLWLDRALEAANADPYLFVVGHHGCFACAEDLEQSVHMRHVCRIVNKWNASAYIHGHHHTLAYYYTNANNTLHVQSGAGGNADIGCAPVDPDAPGEEFELLYGFVRLEISWQNAAFEIFAENGEILSRVAFGTRTPVEAAVDDWGVELSEFDQAVHYHRADDGEI